PEPPRLRAGPDAGDPLRLGLVVRAHRPGRQARHRAAEAARLSARTREDGAVAAAELGLVERLVGGDEQGLGAGARAQLGDADRHRRAAVAAELARDAGQGFADAVREDEPLAAG